MGIRSQLVGVKLALILTGVLFVAGCSASNSAPEWAQRNQRVIDEFTITGRTRQLPTVSVPLALGPGAFAAAVIAAYRA